MPECKFLFQNYYNLQPNFTAAHVLCWAATRNVYKNKCSDCVIDK